MVALAKAPKWGDIIGGEKIFPVHTGQAEVLRSEARFIAAVAGTGGGKTAIGSLWLMKQIRRVLADPTRDLDEDPIQMMVVAPTFKIMTRATAPTLIRAFRGTDFEGIHIPSRNVYHLPGGIGDIWLLSADQPGGLEGGQQDAVWIDEGGQLKYDAWVALQGRTGLKEAPILITTTPYSQNWLFHEVYKKARARDPHYFVKQWASIANPTYSKAEYERAKGNMSAQRAAMRYDGQFVKMAGLVYPDLDSCFVDSQGEIPRGRLVGGIDFGWNNPFAALGASHYVDAGKDIIHVFYERYKRTTGIAAHAKALPKRVRWWADPSRPDSIAELRKADHVVNGAYNDIIVGIDAVNERIYSGRLRIEMVCRAVRAESENYAYPQEDDETYGEKPVDDFNHALDALRYLVMGVDHRKLAKPKEKRQEEFADAA